jgi:hypothetical protein
VNSNSKQADYTVGYGRPPQHSRFQKGQSGNPSGRRRYTESSRAQQLIRQELLRPVPVREGDKVTRMPVLQAIVRTATVRALKGDTPALKLLLKAMQDTATGDLTNSGPVSVRWMTHEEALDALE